MLKKVYLSSVYFCEMYSTCVSSKGRVQKPQARKLSVPPRGLHGRDFSEKLTEKGGYPPPSPLNGRFVAKNGFFSAENGIFCPKTLVLGHFEWIFLIGKEGYPPPPLNGHSAAEKLTEKVNGKGGTPPPPLNGKFPCLGFLNPSL